MQLLVIAYSKHKTQCKKSTNIHNVEIKIYFRMLYGTNVNWILYGTNMELVLMIVGSNANWSLEVEKFNVP